MAGLSLQWHGEGDAVQPEAFRPIELTLTFTYDTETLSVVTTATPEIVNDPQAMRWNVHKLIDTMVAACKEKGIM